MKHSRIRSLTIACATIAIIAGSAAAQGQRGGEQRERPMRGPVVQEEGRTVEGQPQRGAVRVIAREAERPLTHQEFMSVIWMLGDDEAPRGLRLTAEQAEAITRLDRDFQQRMREHQEQIRELSSALREAVAERRERAEGDSDAEGADRPAPRRVTEAERERMQQLRMSMPRPAETHARIRAELNETQLAFLDDELEERRQIAQARRQEEAARRAEQRERMMAEARERFNTPEAREQRQRIGQVMRNIQQLPPEERERILQILEQEVERSLAANPPAEGAQQRGWGGGGWRDMDPAERERRMQRFREMRERREGGGRERREGGERRQRRDGGDGGGR